MVFEERSLAPSTQFYPSIRFPFKVSSIRHFYRFLEFLSHFLTSLSFLTILFICPLVPLTNMDALTLQHICHVSIISKFCVSAYEIQWKKRADSTNFIWSGLCEASGYGSVTLEKHLGLCQSGWTSTVFQMFRYKEQWVSHRRVMLDRFSFTLSCKGDGSHSDNIYDNNCFTLAESQNWLLNTQSYVNSCEAHQEASNSVTCVSCRRWSCTSPASRRSWVWPSATGRMMRRILASMLGR